MKEFIDAISQVGFPIVISILLLVRIETRLDKFATKMEEVGKKLDDNTSATQQLTTIINERIKKR